MRLVMGWGEALREHQRLGRIRLLGVGPRKSGCERSGLGNCSSGEQQTVPEGLTNETREFHLQERPLQGPLQARQPVRMLFNAR